MATLTLASYSTIALYQSSDLNSLATGSYAFGSGAGVSSNVLDNTSNLYVECDVEIRLGSFNPSGTPYIVFGWLWSVDGSTFPDPQTAGAPNAGTPIWTSGVATGSSAKKIVIPRVPMRPLKGKPLIGNVTGSSFASSGNSCTIAPAGYTIA